MDKALNPILSELTAHQLKFKRLLIASLLCSGGLALLYAMFSFSIGLDDPYQVLETLTQSTVANRPAGAFLELSKDLINTISTLSPVAAITIVLVGVFLGVTRQSGSVLISSIVIGIFVANLGPITNTALGVDATGKQPVRADTMIQAIKGSRYTEEIESLISSNYADTAFNDKQIWAIETIGLGAVKSEKAKRYLESAQTTDKNLTRLTHATAAGGVWALLLGLVFGLLLTRTDRNRREVKVMLDELAVCSL